MKRDLITILAPMTALSSCNDDALFEREMYKSVAALISNGYYNMFEEMVTLSPTGEEATGYIVACTGGTHASKQDVVIGLEENLTSLEFYNWSLYDVDEVCYTKFLSSSKYETIDYEIRINVGGRAGRTTIKIRPEELSSDSTYFVGLKATDIPSAEIGEGKNTILYQILIRNDYATQGENVYYSTTGLADGTATAGNKKMFPFTYNNVRMIAGTESFENNVDHINKTVIVLQVEENDHITIKSYKDIEVTRIDGDSKCPDTFKVEKSFGRTYNVFLLPCRYTRDGRSKAMQGELRLEMNN